MMATRAQQSRFLDRLLQIMDRKHHWAWEQFSTGRLSKAQLKIHFQQEYAVYVRDFPVLLARVLGNNPPFAVRHMLAENIYEEETGGLSLGTSHPELFLTMMKGLGYRSSEFASVPVLPAARAYRTWLHTMSAHPQWVLAAATLTVFVEGSVKDRHEICTPCHKKRHAEIESMIRKHPLVRYHGVSPDSMDLIRAHQLVESGHRHDAYEMVVAYTPPTLQHRVLRDLEKTLSLWLAYRDSVARACRIKKPA